MSLHLIDPSDPRAGFPSVDEAEREPDGLLAIGGDLSMPRLLDAYRRGIFPWFNEGQPILWWSPDPRTVFLPERLRLSRSLRKAIRNRGYRVSISEAFGSVIRACAEPRAGTKGTWITWEMRKAYETLHSHGHAHSVEVWKDHQLVGGLYGVLLGRVFFGESMFSRERDTSKIALAHLCTHFHQLGGELVDCQVYSDHLASLGAVTIPRREFVRLVRYSSNNPLLHPDAFTHTPRPAAALLQAQSSDAPET